MKTTDTIDDFYDRIKRTDSMTEHCPVSAALNLLSGKWELKIIFYLLKYDTLRFGELKTCLPGITNTVLTKTLKKFEAANIITRIQYNEIPPHVEYSLTVSGKALLQVFYELARWDMKHQSSFH